MTKHKNVALDELRILAALMVLVFYGTVGVLVALASIKTFSWATQMVVELLPWYRSMCSRC